MPPLDSLMVIAVASLAGLGVIARTWTWTFGRWTELRRAELAAERGASPTPAGNRIEIADLKERVKKLEAIAAGVAI